MGLAVLVALVAIALLIVHGFRMRRARRAKPAEWKHIERIREARASGWSDVSAELDDLLYEQFEQRMAKRDAFWRSVEEAAARARRGPR